MKSNPTAEIDRRFSDPEADPTPWSEALMCSSMPSSTGSPRCGPTVGRMSPR